MKKIYLIATFLGATSLAFNQVQQLPMQISKNTKADKVISANAGVEKAPGQVIWSSDFSNTGEWTIGGDGNQGAWQIGTVADLTDTNYYAPMYSSTSGGNFAFFVGVGYLLNPPVFEQNAWIEMANAIDATGNNMITFSFEQHYRAFNRDETFVEVSLDGGATWEQADDVNSDVAVNTSSTDFVIVRNFTVNGSNAVKFRFRWHSPDPDNNYGSGYAWQVDDVMISSLSDNDISTSALEYGSNVFDPNDLSDAYYYFQIPESQRAPIASRIALKNEGTQTQTGVVFNAYETLNGGYSSSSTAKTIQSGASDTAQVNNNFTPPTTGVYKLEYGVAADVEDDVPSNNIISSYTFRVTQHLYARDASTNAEIDTGAYSGSYYTMNDADNPSQSQAMEIGNVFEIHNAATVYGIEFKLGPVYSPGSLVFGHILDGNLDQIANAETDPYTIQVGDEGKYVIMKFPNGITLQPGEYVASVTCFDPEFSVAARGTSPAQTSFLYAEDEDTWYYVTSTPIVRMNFNPNIGCAQDPAFTFGNLENVCISGGNSISPTTVLNSGGTWTFASAPSDGATINGSNGTISNVTPGNSYLVSYDLGGCTETRTIHVNEFPTVSITASDPALCEGNSTTLTATGANTYFWGVDLGTNPAQTISPATTTTYTVIGYNGACRDTATVQITVTPWDDSAFTFPAFCDASTVYNSPANVVTPGGTFVFVPAPSDGATIDPATGEITGAVAGTTYNIEYTTSGVCATTSTVMVTPTDHDNAGFNFDDGCIGETMLPTGIITSGGSFSFASAPSDGATIDPATGEITNGASGATYGVVYTTPQGACQWSDTLNVTVNALPSISITPEDPSICAGETIELTATGGDSYLWDNLGGGASKNVTPTSTATYQVTGTDANGCSNTYETTVTVNALPALTFDDQLFCDTLTSVEMNASPAGGTFSGGSFVSGTTFDVANAGIGQHQITYTYTDADTGCENTATATFIVQACLGLSVEELNNVVVSPNPTSDFFQVSTIGNNQIKDVQLVSILGEVIPVNYTQVNNNIVEVNVSKLASGTYFVKLNTNKGQLTKKVIVK